jgi:hypothetical protein
MYIVNDELDAVLSFQAQVGLRRHGHYDHDAHGVTGPMGRSPVNRARVGERATNTTNSPAVAIALTRHPETGELVGA